MSVHTGRTLADCPECLKRDGWQDAEGITFAAQLIRHEAQTEQEIDLAELCAAMPDDLDVRHQKNLWVLRKVWRMRAKWVKS